jgi:Fe-S cluster assembly protein SufD
MSSVIDAYLGEGAAVATARAPRDPAWLSGLRRRGLERFAALGFPTPRDEDWRFTSIAPIAEQPFPLARNGASHAALDEIDPFRLPGDAAATLVFVNGHYVPAASSIGVEAGASLTIAPLAQAASQSMAGVQVPLSQVANVEQHAFTALNTAFLEDGAFVSIPDGVQLGAPVHLLFVATGEARAMTHPRVLVVAGASSQATIVESYVGLRAREQFTNAVTELIVRENATLDHYTVQRESADSAHIGGMYVRAARGARISCHAVSLGGLLVRNEVSVVLDGEGGECTLNGLYFGDGRMLVDNHTAIEHAKPHCASREIYKGILAGHARAVFNGKIIVRPEAQKTDAKQTNKALLLSDDAQINTKPQLEIFANDVKCTHGAAVGQLDEEAIFYLRARGLGAADARRLLIRAFAGDVLSRMPFAALGAALEAELVARLPGVQR